MPSRVRIGEEVLVAGLQAVTRPSNSSKFSDLGKIQVVSLSGTEIVKVDWNTRSLIADDFDGDGRLDLALANNDRARVEIFLQ